MKARLCFKISGCTDTSPECFINGRVPIGVALGLPRTYVKQLSISYQDRPYLLDASDSVEWQPRRSAFVQAKH
jgi:hypothetical protein